jgi:AcrR family transcriptional regulator
MSDRALRLAAHGVDHMPLGASAPKQDRSRKTLEAILKATRYLIERKEFSAISISEIVERSGTSNGSFYARFPDKASLLVALQLDSHREVVEELDAKLDPEKWVRHKLKHVIQGMIPVLMHVPDRHLEVFRAALFQSLHKPMLAENVDEITERKIALAARLVLSKRDEIVAIGAERLAFLGARTVELLLQQHRVRMYRRKPPERKYEKQFHAELAEIYLRILGHKP